METIYEIESRSDLNDDGEHTGQFNEWSTDGVGRDGNEFATEAEAQEGIESLRKLGYEWAEAEYHVVEQGLL